MKVDIIYENNTVNELSEYISNNIDEVKSEIGACKTFEVNEKNIAGCTGCLACWYATPGICVKKDIAKELNRGFIKDDFVIIFTPIKYGAFSSTIKKVIDRNVATLLPYLKVTGGENHHVRRYKSAAKQIIIAYNDNLSEEEESMFNVLVKANSLNFDIPKADVFICRTKEELKKAVKEAAVIVKEGGENYA